MFDFPLVGIVVLFRVLFRRDTVTSFIILRQFLCLKVRRFISFEIYFMGGLFIFYLKRKGQ